MSPAITTLAGRGDVDGTIRLSYRSGKLGSFLLLMFAIPVALELPVVLQVWLKNPPEFVVPVCRVILCGLVVSQLTIGHQMAMNANGKIFKWQLVEGCSLASAVLFAYAFTEVGTDRGGQRVSRGASAERGWRRDLLPTDAGYGRRLMAQESGIPNWHDGCGGTWLRIAGRRGPSTVFDAGRVDDRCRAAGARRTWLDAGAGCRRKAIHRA